METLFQKFIQLILIPKTRRAENEIGFRLTFRNLPNRFINGYVASDETATWKKFGIDVERGVNYWTIGKVANGMSSRYDRNAAEYQAWLGGYLFKLVAKPTWTPEDYFRLAIADQNSWLHMYGDPHPMTTTQDWKFIPVGPIMLGRYNGTLYEGGCISHSDVGDGYNAFWLRLVATSIAALFNASNPNLRLKGKTLRPKARGNAYESLRLSGYFAIFDITETIKVVLYANGTDRSFTILRDDFMKAIESCEIKEI